MKITVDGLSIADLDQVKLYFSACFPDAKLEVQDTRNIIPAMHMPICDELARPGVVVLAKSNDYGVWVIDSVNKEDKMVRLKHVGSVAVGSKNWLAVNGMPKIVIKPEDNNEDNYHDSSYKSGNLIFYAWGLPK